jgi:hypothetical protein
MILDQELNYDLLRDAGLTNIEIASTRAGRDLVKENNTREAGKHRQHGTEYLIQDEINQASIMPPVFRQTQLPNLIENYDHNESGYDLMEVKSGYKIQTKYRGGQDIHLENTRRSSIKNKGAASQTGHVVYSEGEFDVLVIVRPAEMRNDLKLKEDLLVINAADLPDRKNPGFLVRSVGVRLERKLWQKQTAAGGAIKYLSELYSEYISGSNIEQ